MKLQRLSDLTSPTAGHRYIASDVFLQLLSLNSINDGLSDAEFREFVLHLLPSVQHSNGYEVDNILSENKHKTIRAALVALFSKTDNALAEKLYPLIDFLSMEEIEQHAQTRGLSSKRINDIKRAWVECEQNKQGIDDALGNNDSKIFETHELIKKGAEKVLKDSSETPYGKMKLGYYNSDAIDYQLFNGVARPNKGFPQIIRVYIGEEEIWSKCLGDANHSKVVTAWTEIEEKPNIIMD